ncbi:hypothetical protein [Clostridium thermarum]|uniref:hypothetical protein n=1 Tax=Clostridium thermarum TaxID=1716543 RepID=UPI00111D31A3|nr:hypothetical protein [Clostridium thermarum]
MKKKGLIAALALTLSIGLGVTAYAAAGNTEVKEAAPVAVIQQRLGLGRITGMRGYEIMNSALKSLGLTDAEITEGTSAGKTPYEIAAAKGISADKFKEAILVEKHKVIDAAVENGSITKDQADALKASLASNAEACTTAGQNSRSMGNGCGGNGLGRGNGAGRGMRRGSL